MNYFIDTEFFEDGPSKPIQLISIGIVSEEGKEFYIENQDVDLNTVSDWLKTNVVPHLFRTTQKIQGKAFKEGEAFGVLPHKDIGPAVMKFIGMDPKPLFWGYFADYDWVVFCQLFGSMINLPPTFPNLCFDMKQEMRRLNLSKPILKMTGPAHNALADAHWHKDLWDYIQGERWRRNERGSF